MTDMRRPLHRHAVVPLVLTVLCSLLLVPPAAVAEQSAQQVYLPEPAGPYQPGTTLIHLVNLAATMRSRPAPVIAS